MARRKPPVSLLTAAIRKLVSRLVYQDITLNKLRSLLTLIPPNCVEETKAEILKISNFPSSTDRVKLSLLLGCFLYSGTKSLELADDIYNDESTVETYLQNIQVCEKIENFKLNKLCCASAWKVILRALKHLSSLTSIKSLDLEDCHKILEDAESTYTIIHNLRPSNIRELQIPGAAMDNDCLDALLRLRNLEIVNLDHCKMTTVGVVRLLTGLPSLTCLSVIWGRTNRVVQAVLSLPHSCQINLNTLYLREPLRSGIAELSDHLPSLRQLRVVWNIHEIGYSTKIDQSLASIGNIPTLNEIFLEISMINGLYLIQLMPKLVDTAAKITRLELLEIEFLHPASLDPIGELPNLTRLTVINPSVIGDDLFLELPELCSTPFPALTHLHYEGELSSAIFLYLTQTADKLRFLDVKSSNSLLGPEKLEHFIVNPKPFLQSFLIEVMIETSPRLFVENLKQIVLQTHSIKTIGRLSEMGNLAKPLVEAFNAFLRENNYDVEIV